MGHYPTIHPTASARWGFPSERVRTHYPLWMRGPIYTLHDSLCLRWTRGPVDARDLALGDALAAKRLLEVLDAAEETPSIGLLHDGEQGVFAASAGSSREGTESPTGHAPPIRAHAGVPRPGPGIGADSWHERTCESCPFGCPVPWSAGQPPYLSARFTRLMSSS